MGKKQYPDQEIHINGGGRRQEIHINQGGRPPVHEARGTAHLVIVVAVAAFLVFVACGVASALTAGAIW